MRRCGSAGSRTGRGWPRWITGSSTAITVSPSGIRRGRLRGTCSAPCSGPTTFRIVGVVLIIWLLTRRYLRAALFLVSASRSVGWSPRWPNQLADRPRPDTQMAYACGTSFPSGHALGRDGRCARVADGGVAVARRAGGGYRWRSWAAPSSSRSGSGGSHSTCTTRPTWWPVGRSDTCTTCCAWRLCGRCR